MVAHLVNTWRDNASQGSLEIFHPRIWAKFLCQKDLVVASSVAVQLFRTSLNTPASSVAAYLNESFPNLATPTTCYFRSGIVYQYYKGLITVLGLYNWRPPPFFF